MTTLSLCVICGDAGIPTLARLLRSFLERPNGPAIDELVLEWNGTNHEEFRRALTEVGLGNDLAAVPHTEGETARVRLAHDVPTLVHYRAWTGDFAAARQVNFELASGEWRMYADTDDVLALPDDPAVSWSMEADGSQDADDAPQMSLREYLRTRPSYVNCIRAPYDYVIDPTSKRTIIRKARPRIVRWDKWWIWESPVHERLVHLLHREIIRYNSGVLLRHDPPVSDRERCARNLEILNQKVRGVETEGANVPGVLYYGLGAQAAQAGDMARAFEHYSKAAERAQSGDEKLVFLTWAAQAAIDCDRLDDAGRCALDVIDVMPNHPAGYLLASEIAFLHRRYEYCVKWYEAGGANPIPPAGMLDDLIEWLIRPVRYVGVAYLYLNKPHEALEVTRLALDVHPDDLAAEKIRDEATERVAHDNLMRSVSYLTERLIKSGFPGTAQRVVHAAAPALAGSREWADLVRDIEEKANGVVGSDPGPDSDVAKWLAGAGNGGTAVLRSLDSFLDPSEIIRGAAELSQEGRDILVYASDRSDMSRTDRLEPLSATYLLNELSRYGRVQELALQQGDQGRFLAARATRSAVSERWRPDVTFWCPAFMESWGPWRLATTGMGGSEESVAYLASELSRRGLNVQVYAPLDRGVYDGVHVQDGVRWLPLESLDPTAEIPGVTVACRAPYAVRIPAFDLNRLLIWHQDIMYADGQWTREIASACGHLWVSDYQRRELLAERLGIFDIIGTGIICGNGVPGTVLKWEAAERDPYACVYLSSPLRGLIPLLDSWPKILEATDGKASLHVYYGWETTPPQLSRHRMEVMAKVREARNVVWHGRVSQAELERALPTYGVWLYPCTFPEGFCIAGIRATAAGLVPIYKRTAGLREVQIDSPFAYDADDDFADMALRGIQASVDGSWDREAARAWVGTRHLWNLVADRIMSTIKGLLG